jgi:hypothetical protein
VFALMVAEMTEWGGFFAFVGILLFCSCICAFMSTSDSIIIACSNTLTMDLWSNWLAPKLQNPAAATNVPSATSDGAAAADEYDGLSTAGAGNDAATDAAAKKIAAETLTLYITKATSVVLTYAAVAMALYSGADIQQLLNIGFGALFHIAPAYYGAIFQLGCHAKPLSAGMLIGLGVTIYAELEIQRDSNAHTNTLAYVFSCYWGFLANICTVVVCELAMKLAAPRMLDDHGMGTGIDDVIRIATNTVPSEFDDDRRPSQALARRPSQDDRRPSQGLARRPSQALASQYVNAWDAIEAEVKRRWGTEPLTPALVERLMQKTVEPVLSFLHKEPSLVDGSKESCISRWNLSCHRHPLLRYAGTAAWVYMQCCLVLGLPWWQDAWVEGETPIGEYGVNAAERTARGEIQWLPRQDTMFGGIPRWCAAYGMAIGSGAFVSILSINFVWVADAEKRHANDGDDGTVIGLTTMQKWLKDNQRQLARLPSHRMLRRLSEQRLLGIEAFREATKEVIHINRAVSAFHVGGSNSGGDSSGGTDDGDGEEGVLRAAPKVKANQIMPATAAGVAAVETATEHPVCQLQGGLEDMGLQDMDAEDIGDMAQLDNQQPLSAAAAVPGAA